MSKRIKIGTFIVLLVIILFGGFFVSIYKNLEFESEDGNTQNLSEFVTNNINGTEQEMSQAKTEDDTDETLEIQKIRFYTLEDESFVVESELDVIDGINRSINKWKYTCESLEFTFLFSSGKSVSEECFEDMRYIEMWQIGSPLGIIVEVAYEDININALMELSKRDEISSIWITIPTRYSTDPESETP